MTLEDTEELRNRLAAIAAQIGEHCTSVQILCSVPVDGGGTRGIMVGCGDWYARQGLAMEFIEQNQAQTQAQARHIGDAKTGEEDE